MRCEPGRLVLSTLLGATLLLTQTNVPTAHSMAMAEDGASYGIYSSLMPLGETGGKDWPHALWLVQNKTITVVPQDQPCLPQPVSPSAAPPFSDSMNPHVAVHPPDRWQQDFKEILADFDAHCHERLDLDPNPNLWGLSAPLRLLTPQEQKEFQSTRFGQPLNHAAAEKYKGAPALYGFSRVYFNASHTVGLVYATHWCGGLCGQGLWIAVALESGHWKRLPWNANTWIS
ncbi:MAG TPA: hypothetical protein VFE27_01550 [Acidobacteriaceae bacterium]|nr:hypothetical protein [Acidobacteriaceae bacterium]